MAAVSTWTVLQVIITTLLRRLSRANKSVIATMKWFITPVVLGSVVKLTRPAVCTPRLSRRRETISVQHRFRRVQARMYEGEELGDLARMDVLRLYDVS